MSQQPTFALSDTDVWTAKDADRPALAAFCRNNPEYDVFLTGEVPEDMIDKGVGHIGLFQVATASHGTGLAHDLYQGLEDWLASRGTDVLRLGVLDGNVRGMAFWTRHGFLETRRRQGTAPNGKTHLSYVMYKPLKPLTLEAYRLRVPRDDPNSV
jgi:ribosomal protein S18 acetylase RimI-like enzyme